MRDIPQEYHEISQQAWVGYVARRVIVDLCSKNAKQSAAELLIFIVEMVENDAYTRAKQTSTSSGPTKKSKLAIPSDREIASIQGEVGKRWTAIISP